MPTNLLSADSTFPDVKKARSTDEKFEVVTNYLYMLLEQLRYTLCNLGLNNINESEFLKMGELITSPIAIQLEGAEGQLAQLQITADGLSTRISDTEGNVSQLVQTSQGLASRVADAEGNISTLTQTAAGLSSRINDAEGDISTLTQTATSLTSRISSAEGNISTVQQTINGLTVTTSSGTTMIKGSSIETGSLVLTGCITWSDLNSGVQSTINTAQSTASSAQSTANSALSTAGTANSNANTALSAASSAQTTLSAWTYGSTTYIDGTQIMTGTVTASSLRGGIISVLGSNGTTYGYLYAGTNTAGSTAFEVYGTYGLRLISPYNVYIDGSAIGLASDDYISVSATTLRPAGSQLPLGNASYLWSAVYASNGTIQTSDENRKHDIEVLPDKYVTMMDMVMPKRYKMDDGQSGRYHVGFIAQDVKAAMDANDIEDTEFGGWVRDTDEEGNEVYFLRYDEFIAILWSKIRKLEEQIDALEGAA